MTNKLPKRLFIKISWIRFEKDCITLSKQIRKLPPESSPEIIIAISRGGLVSARILSDLLSIPISYLTITSYQNLKKEKEPLILETPSQVFNQQNILLVDDIADSGKTFIRAVSYFKNFAVEKILTASVYIKPKTSFIPDFWSKKLNGWVIFPYEVKETTEAFINIYKNKNKALKKLLQLGFKKWEVENII